MRPLWLVILVFSLAPGQDAMAQRLAPPGNSAVDEYSETIPDAGGSRLAGSQPGVGPRGPVLDARTRSRLLASGSDGQAAAALAEDAAAMRGGTPAGADRARGEAGTTPGTASTGRDGGREVPGRSGSAASPLAVVARTVLGDRRTSGMGAGLPLLIVGTSGAAVLVVARRRRTRDG